MDAWLKQALKVAAALEQRPEERLVEDALISYLSKRHAETVANIRKRHGIEE